MSGKGRTDRAGGSDGGALRRRAERKLGEHKAAAATAAPPDLSRVLHELEVHQVELEIQNEELRATRIESERLAERYRELYEFAPLGYATLDAKGAIVGINLAGATLLGQERRLVVGRPLATFVESFDAGAATSFLATALAGGKHAGDFKRAARPTRWVRLTAASVGPEILVAMEDVTERRRRDDELKEALRLLGASQRVARLGTFVMDAATGAWSGSAVLDEILGIGAALPRTLDAWGSLAHPEDRGLMADRLRGALWGDRLELEYRIVRKSDGEVRWVWTVGELEYDGIEPHRLVGTLQDVTERRCLLDERAELLRIAEEARARAEEASRAKDAFMATLSHELRNPLMPLSNGVAILQRSPPGSEASSRAVQVIDRQLRHLGRLVDDLLDATRITRGKVQLDCRPVDLDDLVRNLIEDHRSMFDRNGVQLELGPASRGVVVDGDRDRLAQVIGNLLQNAAKFCQRGGSTRVSLVRERGRAVLRVSDDGVGMTPEMLSRVFEPFTQADSTLDRGKGGLGLGMSLAKGLVEMHGGEIAVQSGGPGRGAEFVVRLPLARGAAVAAGPAARVGAPQPHRRVLIIDDNVDAAESLRELLEFSKHEVGVAYTGSQGLAKARDFHPDVVLCDIGLPGMDGYAVAKAIRADDTLRGVYLVALTGYALPDDARRAIECGFQRHVAKPPDIAVLERLLAEAPVGAGAHAARPA
jgi:two-component system CheB/CheR fusion protein